MVSSLRICVDAAFAVLLAVVLLGVYLADRRGASTGPADPGGGGDPIAEASAPVPIKLAVTPAGFDDMGKLLGTLGDGYRFEVVREKTLADPAACARFDAIFLTCAEAGGPGGADGPARLAPALREFVNNGGTLYASDLRFDTLATAFPELVDHEAVAQGLKQDLRAEVVAAELADLIGGELPLHFDLDGWRPGAFRGESVTVYLKGRFRTTAGDTIDAPLLVKFPFGKGTVLFTSFHNEKQNNATEIKLLKHLVFSTVTARLEATVTRSMVRGGFSLQQSNLLSAAPGDPSMTKSYRHAQPGALSFSLGFEPRGARLRLEVVSPRGERLVKKGDSTLTLDIPDAVAGTWTYTATPESLPYPNFPFTLGVGAAGKPAPDVARAAPPRAKARASGSVRFREVLVGEVSVQAGPKRIAVTEPQFDDMGKLLRTLGDGYAYQTIPEDDLLRPESLDKFDILFLTCNGWPTAWAESLGPAHDREGITIGTVRPDAKKRFKETIERFVNRGGTLYASDLRDEMVLWAFPLRMAVLDLDTTPLANLDNLERSWLEAKAPLAGVGTVAETLKKVQLGPALMKDVDRLIAAIEISDLVKVGLNPPDRDVEANIYGLLWAANLTATDVEIKAIAAALSDWERKIREAARSRPRGKAARSQAQIAQHERQMQAVRERILRDARGVKEQTVAARIIDPGLRDLLGPQISLNFNTEAWVPARFRGDDVVEYIRGEYQAMQGSRVESPLLVKFKEGQGTVIFTSFHNEAQNSRQEEGLLKYLVFSAVTAREQEVADKAMFSGGFSPAKRSLISHSSGQPSVTKLYNSPRPGPLRFSLSFAGRGALIKLTLVAPTGEVYEKEARATLVVEADGATAGDWRYTVTALRVPHENFPFSVSVGEGNAPSGPRPPGR